MSAVTFGTSWFMLTRLVGTTLVSVILATDLAQSRRVTMEISYCIPDATTAWTTTKFQWISSLRHGLQAKAHQSELSVPPLQGLVTLEDTMSLGLPKWNSP